MTSTNKQPGRWVITKFGPPSVLSWAPFDELPAPAENEARVRIMVTGIGSVDNIQRIGGYPGKKTGAPGYTPGYEFVGEVDAVGPGVSSLKVGDRVTSLCVIDAYATHIVRPAAELFPLEPSDDPVKMAALPLNFMTAWGMLKRSGVSLVPGSTVLMGSCAGGLGCAMAQLNTAFDLGLNILGTCSPKNFDFVKSLGITPIDRSTTDLPAAVKALTGGRGVDVAYDPAGSEASIRASFASTAEGTGEVRVVGVVSAVQEGGTGISPDVGKTFELLGSGAVPRTRFWVVTLDYYDTVREAFVEDFKAVMQKVREGKLEPLLGKVFKLDQAVEVNELLAHNNPYRGKMAFVVDDELAKSHGL